MSVEKATMESPHFSPQRTQGEIAVRDVSCDSQEDYAEGLASRPDEDLHSEPSEDRLLSERCLRGESPFDENS
jgi:hypothetical protein